jgi:DNA-binding CsgD family transcriptional regulator
MLQITPWERDALQLLANGKAMNDIATYLGIHARDIESDLTRLFAAMGAATQAEAIAGALKRGLLSSAEADPSVKSRRRGDAFSSSRD